jgi:hypothetical protein
MKINFKNSAIPLAPMIVVLMMSCVGDLNVKPIDPYISTSASVYTTTESYLEGLAKLYAAFALTGQVGDAGAGDVAGVDEGFSDFIRSMWNLQELTTDEAVWTYPSDANGTIFNLHYNTWVASDIIPTALFARIMNVAALTNEFIRVTAPKTSDPVFKQMNAEARFLRALAYYYGMDLYGNMPFVTEKDLPGAYFPKQISRADLFAYIESELLAIKGDLGAPKFQYGRADKAACAMLLAKVYLNAEVYLKVGDTKGPQKYTECVAQLNEVIGSSYSLAPYFLNNFLADNNTSPEIIFSQNFDSQHSTAYDQVNVMIYGNTGNGGWSGLRTTSAFVNKFPVLTEARALFATKGQNLEIKSVSTPTDGYGIYKFRNVNSDGTTPPSAPTKDPHQNTDFPMFRLADAYLMYAEAVKRGGTGGSFDPLTLVNAIRTRSGDVANGNAPGAITSGQLTLDFILDERARELYWEGHRRTDLIRFDKFTGNTYLWPWKGGVDVGVTIENKRALFPIPASDIGSNPNLKQNDGY